MSLSDSWEGHKYVLLHVSKGCVGKQCFIHSYIKMGGMENYRLFKQQLTEEFNALNLSGMPAIDELYAINGAFVNLAYPMANMIRFYRDVLGFEIKEGEDTSNVYLVKDGTLFLLTQINFVIYGGAAIRVSSPPAAGWRLYKINRSCGNTNRKI